MTGLTQHTSLTWWFTIQIPAEPQLVGLVRASLRSALARQRHPDLTDLACLLTSELVTNGIVHTKSPVTIRAFWRTGTLHVTVRDYSAAVPTPRTPTPDDESGRGLALLDACAHAWGIRTADPGKTVWFELR